MGSGGLRGLQILRSGACSVRGGFDSHAFPPFASAFVLALIVALLALAPGPANAQTRNQTPIPTHNDSIRVVTPPSVAGVVDTVTEAASDTARVKRTAPPQLTGFDKPVWVMTRSLVFPAWGQMHNGAWWKAGIIGGTEGVLIYRLIDDRNALNDLSAQIDEARANNDPVTEAALVAEYNDRSNKHVARQWWLGALVAYSMLDAYIDAHFKHFRVDFKDDPTVPPEDRKAAGLKISWQEHF